MEFLNNHETIPLISMNIDEIQNSIRTDDYEIQLHAYERMRQRDVSVSDLEKLVLNGEIIESYSGDRPFPSCLILGMVQNRPLHAVVSYNKSNDKSYIITVYEPDRDEFEDDFKTRK